MSRGDRAPPVASLAVDSRCRLGEGILWDDRRQWLFWTDILGHRLWAYAPRTGATHAWEVPEPLGCLARRSVDLEVDGHGRDEQLAVAVAQLKNGSEDLLADRGGRRSGFILPDARRVRS